MQDNAQKKAQRERILRKNYEIDTLKSELSVRDHDLADTRRRLISLEAAAVRTAQQQLSAMLLIL